MHLDRGVCLLPWPCWCSAHSSSLPPSVWWITEVWMPTTNYAMALLMLRPLLLSTSICLMDHRGLDRGPCLLPTTHTLCHIHWMCCNSVMIPSGHMTFILLSILERDPPLLLSWRFLSLFSLWKGCLGVFPDPVWGQRSGMSMCTDCKALWGKCVIRENGLHKINWIELNTFSMWICTYLFADRSTFVWVFETPLPWLDSLRQIFFLQHGPICSQSDVALIFNQSHESKRTFW